MFRLRLTQPEFKLAAHAALESASSFTTDLPAQYELGFNTVNDVNFSMEQHTSLRTKFTSSNSDVGAQKSTRSTPADTKLRE